MRALYRRNPGSDWTDCEITGRRPDGKLVLREVGKVWPGVWLAGLDQVRVPVGEIIQPAIEPRGYLPDPAKRWGKYRLIRETCGREAALQAVFNGAL